MRGRLLAFALLVACLGAVLSGEQPFDTRSFTVVPGDTLTITSDFGKIRVRPCEGAVLEIRSRRSTDDPSGKSMPVVDIRKEGMTIVVRSVSSGAAGEVVDLDISVPASLSVTISGANPEVDLAGLLQNPMRVQTSTGRITSVDITSDLRLVSQSGDIRYRTGLQPRGDVRLESASGSIYCELEDGLNLRNQLRAGGKIFWDMEPMLEAASLERQLGVLGPLLSAESKKGNVVVRLRPSVRTPVASSTSVPGDQARQDRAAQAPTASEPQRPVQATTLPDETARPAAAGDRQTGSDRGSYSVKVNVDSVFLNVCVLDRNTNRSIAGLQKQDFLVYEDGVAQQIDQFLPEEAPFNLLLLLDVSGSTQSYLSLMQETSIDFTRRIKENDRVALATFNSHAQLIEGFTNDRTAAERAIRRIWSGGGTAFYDALMISIDQYMRGVEGRSAIVVFTDGVDNQIYGNQMEGSRTTFNELYRRVQEIEPLIYTIFLDTEGQYPGSTRVPTGPVGTTTGAVIDILGGILRGGRYPGSYPDPRGYPPTRPYPTPIPDPTPNPYPTPRPIPGGTNERAAYQIAREQLMSIAEQTGGRMYSPYRIEELSRIYSEIADDLRVQYQLGYSSTNPARDGKWRQIRVVVRNNPQAAVRTRKGYYARKDAG